MSDAPGALRGRTQLDLTTAQLRAIDAWNDHRRTRATAAVAAAATREQRLDLSRRTEALAREQRALQACADAQLATSGGVLNARARVRAVLAHRNAWLRDSVAERLVANGVAVVGLFEDGADVAGAIVVEQPELVLVEDRLPTLSGIEVVRRARTYAPDAVVVAQCLDESGIAPLADAGAQAVFTRRIPPQDLADRMLALLPDGAAVPVVVS